MSDETSPIDPNRRSLEQAAKLLSAASRNQLVGPELNSEQASTRLLLT